MFCAAHRGSLHYAPYIIIIIIFSSLRDSADFQLALFTHGNFSKIAEQHFISLSLHPGLAKISEMFFIIY